MSQVDQRFLTLDELAARWKVKRKWVYSNHSRLGVPILPLGRQLRFPIAQLEEWETKNLRCLNRLTNE